MQKKSALQDQRGFKIFKSTEFKSVFDIQKQHKIMRTNFVPYSAKKRNKKITVIGFYKKEY